MSNLTSRTLQALGWSFSGGALQAVSQLVVIATLARFLAPAEFGVASLAMVLIAFVEIFTQLGVAPALVQRLELTRSHEKTARLLATLAGGLFAVALWASSPYIARFFENDELENVLKALSPLLLVQGLATGSEALLQRKLAFKKIARITALSQVFGYGVPAVCFALTGFGVWALVFAQISKIVTRSVCMYASSESRAFGFDRSAAKDLMHFGAGFSLAKVFNFVALQGDYALVGKLMGASTLGIYGRAYHLVDLASSLVGGVLDQVLFPALSHVQDNRSKAAAGFCRSLNLLLAVFLPISAMTAVFAREIVEVLMGSAWKQVIYPLQILSLGIALRAGYRISDSLARAMGAVYRRALRQAAYAALVLVGVWCGHYFGIPGVALGVSFALASNYLMMLQLSASLLDLTWRECLRVHLLGMVLGGAAVVSALVFAEIFREVGARPIVVVLCGAASTFCVLAIVAVSSFRLLSEQDQALLRDVVRQRSAVLARHLMKEGA